MAGAPDVGDALVESISASVAKLESACSLLTLVSIKGNGQKTPFSSPAPKSAGVALTEDHSSGTYAQANVRQLEGLLALAEEASRRKQTQVPMNLCVLR